MFSPLIHWDPKEALIALLEDYAARTAMRLEIARHWHKWVPFSGHPMYLRFYDVHLAEQKVQMARLAIEQLRRTPGYSHIISDPTPETCLQRTNALVTEVQQIVAEVDRLVGEEQQLMQHYNRGILGLFWGAHKGDLSISLLAFRRSLPDKLEEVSGALSQPQAPLLTRQPSHPEEQHARLSTAIAQLEASCDDGEPPPYPGNCVADPSTEQRSGISFLRDLFRADSLLDKTSGPPASAPPRQRKR